MKLKEYNLVGGSLDGGVIVCSGTSSYIGDEWYVSKSNDGKSDGCLYHLNSFLREKSKSERRKELFRIEEYNKSF